ncbi:class I SAM-dependent methyltransferase [Verrucomicrobium spinosum]|uniref:class I SAM-dependent methyltransferase n=1 Tax=Verrucomicrobium spinosum TaxID=2736 RepID=UPI000AF772CD|nr:class I SAM-dependent methyltransferase [Verrucomicrobium spinosum]
MSSAETSAPSPGLFFETINAYQRTAALKAGVELGVFTVLASGVATAEGVAERCQCPVRGVRILCDSLAIFGLLTKVDGRYFLTQDSALFLDQNSPAYLGGMLQFMLAPSIIEAFSDLASTVRSGRVHTTKDGTTAPDHPVWVEFAKVMRPMMQGAAQAVAGLVPPVQVDATRQAKVLDISASHGAFGIAFAQQHPGVHLVALDWEAVLAVTEANAKSAGLADRFSKLVGDAFTVDLGTDYDVVLVPNFLHHFNIADCTRFLKRVKAALRPGGGSSLWSLCLTKIASPRHRQHPSAWSCWAPRQKGTPIRLVNTRECLRVPAFVTLCSTPCCLRRRVR